MKEDGSVEVEVPVKSFRTNGNYYIHDMLIEDKSGKDTVYRVRSHKEKVYRMPSYAEKSIALKDSYFELKGFQAIDKKAPVLLSKPEYAQQVVAGSDLDLKLKIKEEISGLRRMIGIFSAINFTKELRARVNYVASPNASDQTLTFKVRKDQPEGEYRLRYLYLQDKKMNAVRYNCDKETMKFKGTDIECPIIRVIKASSEAS